MTSDKRFPSQRRGIVVGVVLVLVLAIAVISANLALGNAQAPGESSAVSSAVPAVSQSTSVSPAPSDVLPAPSASVKTDWPTNASGESYGSSALAKSYEDVPDLVKVMATNGEVGYAFRASLDTPPEAYAGSENEVNLKGWDVPVYESDGVTQIGVFTVGGPGSEIGGTKADGTKWKMVSNTDGTVTTTVTKPDGSVEVTTK